jgi:hypothetical protein
MLIYWLHYMEGGGNAMINRLRIEPQINNECEICGVKPTTAEGLMCRKHWNMAEGLNKAAYTAARTRLITDVFTKESLRK